MNKTKVAVLFLKFVFLRNFNSFPNLCFRASTSNGEAEDDTISKKPLSLEEKRLLVQPVFNRVGLSKIHYLRPRFFHWIIDTDDVALSTPKHIPSPINILKLITKHLNQAGVGRFHKKHRFLFPLNFDK